MPPDQHPRRRHFGSLAWAGLALSAAMLLGGCAAQSSFRDAQRLLANQQDAAGLAKLHQALALEPGNTEYRTAYLITRQKLLAQLLDQAGQAQAAGRRSEAEEHYRRMLGIDAGYAPARSGLAALERDARHDQQLALAEADWAAARADAARAVVLAVLHENPKSERARGMLRRFEAAAEVVLAETRLSAAYRKPVSIDFKEATIKQVFDLIARTSGLNILFDKDVKTDQKTSIALKDSTVEAAIYFMLLTNQLEQQVMDANTILIYPNNAGKLKEYQQLVVRTFVLSNANAKAVAEMIRTVVKSQQLVVDEKLNMVILRDSPEAIRLAEKLVALQDVAEPEVMLEVEILEIARDRLTELGVAWPGSLTLAPLAGESGVLTLRDLRSVRRESLGVTLDPLKISARKDGGDTNLLANPRIRVLNREKARIVIGNKVPVITTSLTAVSGTVSDSVSYLDVGLKLDVEPIIYVDNDVSIKLSLEVSNIINRDKTAQGTVFYTIGTRSANTTLRLKDGENQVLAGLINDEDRRTANKVPGLGDLPLAGRLFGSTLDEGKKSEIVLSITPHLIRNVQRPVAAAAEFPSGTENSLRRRPPPNPEPAPAPAAASAPAAATAQPPASAASAASPAPLPGATRPAPAPGS